MDTGDTNTDEELIRLIATARDRAAFAQLFERYAGRIKGAIMAMGAAPDEADEAMQEAMLSIWRRAESYNPALAPASAWIFAIARNRRIDMIRRNNRPVPDPHDPLFRPAKSPSPDQAFAARERHIRIQEAVAELTEEQREVVRLAFFTGLSHSEIAARTGAPPGTVKSRIRLAVAHLRRALGAEFVMEIPDD